MAASGQVLQKPSDRSSLPAALTNRGRRPSGVKFVVSNDPRALDGCDTALALPPGVSLSELSRYGLVVEHQFQAEGSRMLLNLRDESGFRTTSLSRPLSRSVSACAVTRDLSATKDSSLPHIPTPERPVSPAERRKLVHSSSAPAVASPASIGRWATQSSAERSPPRSTLPRRPASSQVSSRRVSVSSRPGTASAEFGGGGTPGRAGGSPDGRRRSLLPSPTDPPLSALRLLSLDEPSAGFVDMTLLRPASAGRSDPALRPTSAERSFSVLGDLEIEDTPTETSDSDSDSDLDSPRTERRHNTMSPKSRAPESGDEAHGAEDSANAADVSADDPDPQAELEAGWRAETLEMFKRESRMKSLEEEAVARLLEITVDETFIVLVGKAKDRAMDLARRLQAYEARYANRAESPGSTSSVDLHAADNAALDIQRTWRGHRARVAYAKERSRIPRMHDAPPEPVAVELEPEPPTKSILEQLLASIQTELLLLGLARPAPVASEASRPG
eukprot:TRINITY_DN1106_c0_g1_i1.p1 TRINITY_DN1106_c0_g1~~TRINITY_DN1106_c0_g1_i1.p1  ORF type:complete len:503 (+),score=95.05 TRINITY_DN1106_c0_g1_i1:139-1647(+)